MKTLLSVLLLLLCFFSQAQTDPANNLLLGYQEFPTTIQGQASDAAGNLYYTGYFKGQLKVDDKILAIGQGLEDVFWIKRDAAENTIRYKTFGTSGSDLTIPEGMTMMGKEGMVFIARTTDLISFGSVSVSPYIGTLGPIPTTCIVYTDTTGKVLWVKKTKLQVSKLFYANNVLHLFGLAYTNQPAIAFGDSTVVDSLGAPGLVHLMLDATGKLLSEKTILGTVPFDQVSLQQVGEFSDHTLFYSLRITSTDSFKINSQKVLLPSSPGSYHVLVKTDTAYQHITTKLLNPDRYPIGGGATIYLPICMGPKDSLYSIFNYENVGSYTLDSFKLAPQVNQLFVFDSSLKVVRTLPLGSSFAGSYPGSTIKRRLYFRQILWLNNQLFFTGQFTGINESPSSSLLSRDSSITPLFSSMATMDLNGPSKSFVAKCTLTGSSSSFAWTGNHTTYENLAMYPNAIYPIANNRFSYTLPVDNVWNPWIIDTALTIVKGSMRSNADLPETPQMIQFFPDGSRIILGFAQGKTAMDSSSKNLSCNFLRKDVFVVRIRANNEVVWFKRFYATLLAPEARKLEVRNNKAYFLVNFLNTQNDSNYIRVENTSYGVKVNASLLASIDTAGNINAINLRNSTYRNAYLRDFSFFANGDLAVLTNSFYAVPYKNFPASGFQLLRVQEATASIIDARKIYGIVFPNVQSLQIDKDDRIYISGMASNNTTGQLYLHDGTATIDTLVITKNSTGPQIGLLKMDWNHFIWNKQFSGSSFSNAPKQMGDLFLQNNRPVLLVSSMVNNLPLLWNGTLIHNGPNAGMPTFVALDSAGSLERSRLLPSIFNSYARKGSNGQYYVSGGMIAPSQVDTISIGNAGGSDGVGLVLDSAFIAKKMFRIASPFGERLLDMDFYKDSLAGFAYIAQTAPQVYTNRTAIQTGDYEEDAYVSTAVSRTNITTGLNDPLPPCQAISVAPNPIIGNQLQLEAGVTTTVRSVCFVYNNSGQFITSSVLTLSPGNRYYNLSLPASAKKGMYYVVIHTKEWTTTRRFSLL